MSHDAAALTVLRDHLGRVRYMRDMVEAISGEYLRYKALADGALAQVEERHLCVPGPNAGNSLAIIVWHVSGNLASRFTDLLTSDGEKPWRRREEEFSQRTVSRAELLVKWESGWRVLMGALAGLTDADMGLTVYIRRQPIPLREALLRSLAHVSYHVGQIVYLAKAIRGPDWRYLSIPPGASEAYNANPLAERARDHAERLGTFDDATDGRT